MRMRSLGNLKLHLLGEDSVQYIGHYVPELHLLVLQMGGHFAAADEIKRRVYRV